jgi:hypothetical protein
LGYGYIWITQLFFSLKQGRGRNQGKVHGGGLTEGRDSDRAEFKAWHGHLLAKWWMPEGVIPP